MKEVQNKKKLKTWMKDYVTADSIHKERKLESWKRIKDKGLRTAIPILNMKKRIASKIKEKPFRDHRMKRPRQRIS